MDIGLIAGLQAALQEWDESVAKQASYIERHQNPDGGEPDIGYSEWDDAMTSFDADLAEAGHTLAEAIRKATQ